MLPVIFTFLRTYAPYVTLPVAAVVGFIGYNLEAILSDKYTPYQKSIEEKREDRLMEENLSKDVTKVDSLKERKFVPRSVFEKNVSPSLQSNETKRS
ncbi:Small integral membrane protein 12-A [Cryptotermes secundus]|uniref:Small integral membrane protein 12-A n=1 Tax=Cryptotermes secundus TaxID=105785 RepID=A0A2J7QJK2_9NEOP|nr:Small integral membrane protein 12-A [Cryptotermes secundus]